VDKIGITERFLSLAILRISIFFRPMGSPSLPVIISTIDYGN